MSQLKKGRFIFFEGEKLPFKVMAVSENYAVVSRKLDRSEDADLLWQEVKRGAYTTFTKAYRANKQNPVYSLLDLKESIKGPDNYIFSPFNYFDEADCEKAITALSNNDFQISHRSREPFIIDWTKSYELKVIK